MNPEQDDNAIFKVAWSVLFIGAVVLAAVLAWKWYSMPGTATTGQASGTVAQEVSVQEAQPAAPAVMDTPGPVQREPLKAADILERDPGLIQRQAKMLRAEAAASEKSDAGPSSLALTEERIREIEKKRLILQ